MVIVLKVSYIYTDDDAKDLMYITTSYIYSKILMILFSN